MRVRLLLTVFLFGLASLLAPPSVHAQRRTIPRYTPRAGQTMPRELNLFRQDTGAIGDPYNAFEVPRMRLDSQIQRMNNQELNDTLKIQQELKQIKNVNAGPTGKGSTFMNYSHYFNTNNSSRNSANRAR